MSTTHPRNDFEDHADMIVTSLLASRGLRRLRIQRGLTITQMSALIGCSVGQISRVERGQRLAPPPAFLADRLEITEAQLMALCPVCAYQPAPGRTCQECGSSEGLTDLMTRVVKTFTAMVVKAIVQQETIRR
jgi:hypothetical protein